MSPQKTSIAALDGLFAFLAAGCQRVSPPRHGPQRNTAYGRVACAVRQV